MRIAAAALLAGALFAVSVSRASGADTDCRAVLDGVFEYAGMVFPASRVECASVKTRIRVYAELTRDDVIVAIARRDCRHTTVCHLTFDASVRDLPGDQRYCARVWGTVGPNRSAGEASGCESDVF
jgi:hypothetical protein